MVIEKYITDDGWTDLQVVNGQLWGFKSNLDVMPQEVSLTEETRNHIFRLESVGVIPSYEAALIRHAPIAVTAIAAIIDVDSKQLLENPPQFLCEYCEYGCEECGKPATHHYFPVTNCGVNFLCSQHATKLRKLGEFIFRLGDP